MPIFTVYLYSLIILFALELALIKPHFFISFSIFSLFLTAFYVWLSVRAKFSFDFWRFLISPIFFLSGGIIFLGFLDHWFVKQLVVIFLTVANTIFIYWLVIHTFHKYRYKNHSLANISRIINISTIFFWLSSISNLYIFFRIPMWSLFLAATLVIYLTIYQFFNINKIKRHIAQPFIIIITLTVLELFYILTWLPLLSLVKAILITSFYYFLTGLSKHYLQSTLAKTVYIRYSLILAVIWLTVLLTARWE